MPKKRHKVGSGRRTVIAKTSFGDPKSGGWKPGDRLLVMPSPSGLGLLRILAVNRKPLPALTRHWQWMADVRPEDVEGP